MAEVYRSDDCWYDLKPCPVTEDSFLRYEKPIGLFKIRGLVHLGEYVREVDAIIDTGADYSLIAGSVYEEFEAKQKVMTPVFGEIMIDGRWLQRVPLQFSFPTGHPYSLPLGFAMVEKMDVADVWLGQDFLSKFEIRLDGPRGLISFIDPARS